jgi:hypothetical protein
MGSIPAEGDGFLGTIKIHRRPSLVGDVKTSVPCRKMLRHAKNPFEVRTKIFLKAKYIISFPSSSCCAIMIAGRIARQLWWTNHEFPCRYHSTFVFYAYIPPEE